MKCVLIVEDNPDLQFLYRRAMTLEGYDVQMTSNGQEALDYLRSGSELPQVIVLDLMMPVMDGFKFLEIQKKDHDLKDIPVVVCSASKERNRIPSDVEFHSKPLEIDNLLKVIENYCGTLK